LGQKFIPQRLNGADLRDVPSLPENGTIGRFARGFAVL
jgi:hypothetical protein